VDESRLATADAAYAMEDWTTAAREYLAAAAGSGEGTGYAYHRAGNALMRLKRIEDACGVYDRALQDASYADNAAVACNLGTARASLGSTQEAARAFERALVDLDYPSRYKALQGLAGIRYQEGRTEDAAEAYRQAALDDANPDPGKALNNLGLCFMDMQRPEDAVEAYRAAVDLEGYPGRGKAAANLGMAYAALGMCDRAIAAFDRARDEFHFEPTPAVEAAYRQCVMSSAALPEAGHAIGRDDAAHAALSPERASSGDDDSRFFTITDAEMKVADRDARRIQRKEHRTRRPLWVGALVWGALAALVASGVVAAYLLGYGYPTQQMTIDGMLTAYAAGDPVADYWVAVPATDFEEAMARSIPEGWKSYEIGSIVRSARTSVADVTVTLEQGGVMTYRGSLSREGVGWKVNGISTSFDSMGGDK
jgi:Tfp pilus assembly protein PilF